MIEMIRSTGKMQDFKYKDNLEIDGKKILAK